jgi:hypothetical protein
LYLLAQIHAGTTFVSMNGHYKSLLDRRNQCHKRIWPVGVSNAVPYSDFGLLR